MRGRRPSRRERFHGPGCILIGTLTRRPGSDEMPRVGVYDQVKKALQDLIAPELHSIRGDMHAMRADIRVLDQKIDALDRKVDGVDARLTVKIDALDEKIDGLDVRLTSKVDSLRTELVAEIRRVDVRIDDRGECRSKRPLLSWVYPYRDIDASNEI